MPLLDITQEKFFKKYDHKSTKMPVQEYSGQLYLSQKVETTQQVNR